MVNDATARQAHANLAVATRLYGADSPEADTARRTYRSIRLAAQIAAVRDELGGFTANDRDVILDALDGHEETPDE